MLVKCIIVSLLQFDSHTFKGEGFITINAMITPIKALSIDFILVPFFTCGIFSYHKRKR